MAKIPQARRLLLRTRAQELLAAGNDENTAAQIMVGEQLCSAPIARGIVREVATNSWPAPTPRKSAKKR